MRKGTKTLIALAIVAALLLLAISGVKNVEKNKAVEIWKSNREINGTINAERICFWKGSTDGTRVSAYKLTVIYTAKKSNGYFAHSEEYTVVLIYSGFSLVGYQTING